MNILQIHSTEITGNAPEEITLLPPSPVMGRDGRVFTWSFETVSKGWEKHAQEPPIDTDHKSEYGFSTEASGWIKSIFTRDGSLKAKVEWTEEGKKLVSQKKYRYISPAFYTNEFNEVQYVSSAALTNHPNLKMPALNRKNNNSHSANLVMETEGLQNNKNKNTLEINNQQQEVKKESITPMDKQLLNKTLGLDEKAEFDVALNTVLKLKEQHSSAVQLLNLNKDNSAVKVDLNNFVPKADYEVVLNSKNELQAKLQEIETNTLKVEANSIVNEAVKNGQISENSRSFYLDRCNNQKELEEVRIHLNSKQKLSETIHANKTKSNTPQTHSLTAEEISVGKKMGHTEEDLLKAKEAMKQAEEDNK